MVKRYNNDDFLGVFFPRPLFSPPLLTELTRRDRKVTPVTQLWVKLLQCVDSDGSLVCLAESWPHLIWPIKKLRKK